MVLLKYLPVALAYGVLQVLLRFKDDSELARRLKAREPRAMEDLYERYGRLAYSLIFRVVRECRRCRRPGARDFPADLEPRTVFRPTAWGAGALGSYGCAKPGH